VVLSPIQRSVARDVAGVFGRVAVAEHDLLEVAAVRERRTVRGLFEQAPQRLGRPARPRSSTVSKSGVTPRWLAVHVPFASTSRRPARQASNCTQSTSLAWWAMLNTNVSTGVSENSSRATRILSKVSSTFRDSSARLPGIPSGKSDLESSLARVSR
jgi:hypothetical protein